MSTEPKQNRSKWYVAVLAVLLVVVGACKKQPSTPVPLTTASPTWGLNKTWRMDGEYRQIFIENGKKYLQKYQVIDDSSVVITVLNDSTIRWDKVEMIYDSIGSTPDYRYFRVPFNNYTEEVRYYVKHDSITYHHAFYSYRDEITTEMHSN